MASVFHESRSSICPECRKLLVADYVQREDGLILEKRCPEHGAMSTRVARTHAWLAGLQEFAAHSFEAEARQTAIEQGCPWDCGECPDHRQKSAFFLFEITDGCNLNCPICLGAPHEQGSFVSVEDFGQMAAAVVAYAGEGQIGTLGGGEPTLHPQLLELVGILKHHGFGSIFLYTNGLRIARDAALAKQLADEGVCVVLQWDAFADSVYQSLRGRALLEEKRQALSQLKSAGGALGLCTTAVAGVNDNELGRIYSMFAGDRAFGLLDIATMAFVGKGSGSGLGRDRRITSEDVVMALEAQTDGTIRASDFSPVSFSHPECLQIAYLLAEPDGSFVPLKRILDPEDYRELIADKPLLAVEPEMEDTFREAIDRLWATRSDDPTRARGLAALRHMMKTLFPSSGALSADEIAARSAELVKVVLVHSYMDNLNFDVGRSKMCISRTILPDGRLVPTCAYNVIHREADRSDQ